jgi:signal transduction histidine kinase/ligand-binding sensor domain-containing protein/CheY-like chemotaxis protein
MFAAPLRALDPATPLTRFMLDEWQSEQGLPQNSVTSVLQTRDGYLWLGTQEGLVRFDGVRFTIFDTRNTPEIGHNFVLTLMEDRRGTLWIGTYGGVTRLAGGRFTHFSTKDGLPNEQVRTILEDHSGRLWVGTLGGGAATFDGARFVQPPALARLAPKRIRAIVEDARNTLWMATEDGLVRVENGDVRILGPADGLPSGDVRALLLDPDGTLWLGTDGGGLIRYAGGVFTAWTTRNGLSNDLVRALYRDRSGSLWIGTWGGGVQRMGHGLLSTLSTREGLASDQIWAFYEDREGSLWIGTDAGGLARLKRGKFTAITARDGLSSDVAITIAGDSSGGLWAGTYDAGLTHIKRDGGIETIRTANGLAHDTIQTLLPARDGTLWIGTSGGGLNHLAKGALSTISSRDGLSSDLVRSLLEDRDGALWVGTDGGGLNRIREGKIESWTTSNGLANDGVLALLQARDGTVWIGTDGGGLSRFQNGRFTTIDTRSGLSHDIVSSLYEDADGALWIGTSGGGINRLAHGRLAAVGTKQGLFDDTIFSITEDAAGFFWMTCNKGVFRVARRELEEVLTNRSRTVRSQSFGIADGMKSVECNAGSPAAYEAPDGALWFPTIRGIVRIDPLHFPRNAAKPPVVIEGAVVDGRPLTVDDVLHLAPGTHSLEIHYTALSFRSPERVQFRYRLEGFDETWIDAGTRRTAYYTNLPHGDYRFHVIASNDDGIWNEAGVLAGVSVEPRLIETAWFRVATAALLVAFIYAIYRARVWQLHARERTLSALVAERTNSLRIAKERTEEALAEAREHERLAAQANEAKSVFLANMSHELRTPLNAVLGFTQLLGRDPTLSSEGRHEVSIIQRSGEHLLGLINDVLSISKIEAGKLTLDERPFDPGELLLSVRSMIRIRADAKGLNVVFETGGELPQRVFGDDIKLRQVLLNLLGNAVKFTEHGAVALRVRWADGRASFEVADTGPGIAPDELERLFQPFVQSETGRESREGTGLGLVISRQIVQLMQGDISVESRRGSGTTFRFDVRLPETELASTAERGKVVGLAEGEASRRVLVVDDTDENRLLLVKLLSSTGFTVAEAANGAQAVELWETFAPDAIFMDMRMPVMDGSTAASRIRELERASSRPRVSILALTASVFEHERHEILESGCDDFILKPFRVDTIFDKLAQHTGARYRFESSPASAEHAEDPVLDVRGGVARASGNTELYWSLVERFADESEAQFGKLAGCLATGDVAEAADVLHAMRGTAGTLGALKIADEAGVVEMSLRRTTTPSIVRLGEVLEELRAETRRRRGVGTDEDADADAPLAADRIRDAVVLADRLQVLLARNDLAALECIQELQLRVRPHLSDPIGEVRNAIDILDFDAALVRLGAVRPRLEEMLREFSS